ncbi:glycogen synthase [Clostridium cibarium]|uniref:starch synthase n=1 Tax=Clostridium cibarium TaxID=2762247 RepID=A0ABR8PW95_9CLOT|nr:glycogen/starch synthase [Clostridium cibarium]MBD7912398.1 glycogen synthase [Clostridium cibarium]
MSFNEKVIIHIGAEVVPFSKIGGLGDVIGSLPMYFSKKTNWKNVVITPYYSGIKENLHSYKVFNICFNAVSYEAEVLYAKRDNVIYYFVKMEEAYAMQDGYLDGNKPYLTDVGLEYLLFGKCIAHFIKDINFKNVVLITHDWHASGIYPYIKNISENIIDTLHIIHNYQHQGQLYPDIFNFLEDDIRIMGNEILKYTETISMSAFAIFYANHIITVSKNYASELLEKRVAHPGLDYFEKAKKEVIGIINGIDEEKWNPYKSNSTVIPYNANYIENKVKNKEKIKEKYNIKTANSRPLLLILCRLTQQKGLDLFINMGNRRVFDYVKRMKNLISLGVDIIICGVPAGGVGGKVNKQLLEIEREVGLNFRYLNRYSDSLAEELLAGSDILLHPSNYEPCGLTPMYAMRYGTIPIVTKVGGLVDIVKDIKLDDKNGTGFVMKDVSYNSLYESVQEAKLMFKDKVKWNNMMKRGMVKDFSWSKSIDEYVKVIEGEDRDGTTNKHNYAYL